VTDSDSRWGCLNLWGTLLSDRWAWFIPKSSIFLKEKAHLQLLDLAVELTHYGQAARHAELRVGGDDREIGVGSALPPATG
jgi:hypothetical protein